MLFDIKRQLDGFQKIFQSVSVLNLLCGIYTREGVTALERDILFALTVSHCLKIPEGVFVDGSKSQCDSNSQALQIFSLSLSLAILDRFLFGPTVNSNNNKKDMETFY